MSNPKITEAGWLTSRSEATPATRSRTLTQRNAANKTSATGVAASSKTVIRPERKRAIKRRPVAPRPLESTVFGDRSGKLRVAASRTNAANRAGGPYGLWVRRVVTLDVPRAAIL